MRYFIERVSSADGAVFKILDGLCRPLYLVSTVYPLNSYCLHVDGENGAAAKIIRIPLPSVTAYSVFCGSSTFRIVLSGEKCAFHGIDFCIRGSILSKNYDIISSDSYLIAAVSVCRCADAVELNVFDESRSTACICAAVCLNLAQPVDNMTAQPV